MPTFLSDPPQAVYLILGALVFATGLVWFNRRSRKSLAVFLGVMLLAVAVGLIDMLFESPREEAVRRVKAMAHAADAKDNEAFVSHLADTVTYQGDSAATISLSREDLRRAPFWTQLRQLNAHVAVWDFSRTDVKEIDDKTIEIGFLAKGEADGKQMPMYFRATFTRQPDGTMKMSSFASYDPMTRNKPLSLAGSLPAAGH
jgi:hypothetical protein